MKKLFYSKTLLKGIAFSLLGLTTLSCQDYLDKADAASISDKDVFGKFFAYQGFVEDMYEFVVDVANRDMHGKSNFNWGDDLTGSDVDRMGDFTDRGDYWMATWFDYVSPFTISSIAYGENGGQNHRPQRNFWGHGWFGIRRANIALSRIDEMIEPYYPQGLDVDRATLLKEQKELIQGQSYFFRGYFHWEIIRSWGGMPYIDRVISPNDLMQEPRLSYQQTALKIAEDLKKSAALLPADWDETPTGAITKGNNKNRLTKGAAIALNGKNYLYAASPLMNGTADPSIPGSGVYQYNTALCDSAAKQFAQIFELERKGYYELVPVPYSDTPTEWAIEDANGETKYLDCSEFVKGFYTLTEDLPTNNEIIFTNSCNGHTMWEMGVTYMKEFGGFNCHASPTANYVEYFGMADGSRFAVHPEDPSTFDNYRGDCWNRRDPRFYLNIVKDGDKMCNFDKGTSMVPPRPGQNYAKLYSITYVDPIDGTSNIGRDFSAGASCTGYSWKKFYPFLRNGWDLGFDNTLYTVNCPKIRLADVYLMYAEAVNEVYGPNGTPSYCDLSAVDAVNKVRARFHVPGVPSEDIVDKETFRETIRRERAVELAFENHRWYDLRRWYVLGDTQYTNRYKLTFDHDHTIFRRELITQFPFETKHYWMPIRIEDVNLYPSFGQNPGW